MQADTRDAGSIPGSGRPPGGEHSNPVQHPCLENAKDRGAWQAAVHRAAQSQTRLRDLARTHIVFRFAFPSTACKGSLCSTSSTMLIFVFEFGQKSLEPLFDVLGAQPVHPSHTCKCFGHRWCVLDIGSGRRGPEQKSGLMKESQNRTESGWVLRGASLQGLTSREELGALRPPETQGQTQRMASPLTEK